MTNYIDTTEAGIDRRTVLKYAATATGVGLVGLPTVSGSAFAQELESCGLLDITCAIDTSGSLNGDERASLQAAVNGFIDELPTDGSVQIGTFEFGNGGLRNKNDLTNPSGLSVTVSATGGNTPMAGALDAADQAVYGDAAARSDALKLVLLFTDGGPNYTNTQYSLGGYTAPRDSTADWSAVDGNGTYDNADTASATVSEGEMDETALVADAVRAAGVGAGATMIATVYIGAAGQDTQAMTAGAISAYTDLPTYLSSHIASSSDLAIDADLGNVSGLVADLVELLESLCCEPCPTDFYLKYEWTEDEESEGPCAGEFVVYDHHDEVVEAPAGIELVSVTCDEDGEPQQACFATDYCNLSATVKAGRGTETTLVEGGDASDGFCLTGITTENRRGKSRTHAISNVVFECPSAVDPQPE